MILPRLYPIVSTELLERRGCSIQTAVEAMLEGGARIIQFRHKDHFSRSVFAAAEQISKLCHEAESAFVINDRADIAMLFGAGLHIGQDDLDPSDARRLIGADALLGFSTHNAEQLEAAADAPVDYVAVGPVYQTASKQNPDPVVGLELLRKLRKLTQRPMVAIGGITRKNAAAVFEAGADSVAVIGDMIPEVCDKLNLRTRTEEWLQLITK